MGGISAYLIAANIGRCVPRGKGATPKVELQPLGTPTKMQRIAGARHIAVRLWRSRSVIVCNIVYIAAPWM